jgi:CubicO group peptidase (beta-lactamase class C family)
MKSTQDIKHKLSELVDSQRESTGLIGLGVSIFQSGEVVATAVSGERKKGSKVLLCDKDKWHIGSITKAFTSTMIARLVEKGELSWSTTIKEAFSEGDEVEAAWFDVTLELLLTHTAGVPANFPFLTNFKRPEEGIERMRERESAVIKILQKEPETVPGNVFEYSNVSYTIAGVMAEKKTGMSWEELIRREILTPLEISSGGFGHPQDESGELKQPRGHKKVLVFTYSSGAEDDNSPIMGPAGTMHMNLSDMVLFGNEHLQGALGNGALLQPETYRRLHQPSLDDYAYGWIVDSTEDLGVGPILWHNGSNTLWYALLVIFPEIDTVIAITCNDGDILDKEQCAWDLVKKLVKLPELSRGVKTGDKV